MTQYSDRTGKIAKMNWIIYVAFSAIKLFIVSGLVLLSLFVLPVVLLLLSLGMSLSYLREIEPRLYSHKLPSITFAHLSLADIKSSWQFLFPQIVLRLRHILAARDKPGF